MSNRQIEINVATASRVDFGQVNLLGLVLKFALDGVQPQKPFQNINIHLMNDLEQHGLG